MTLPRQTPGYDDFQRRVNRWTVLVALAGTLLAALVARRQVAQGLALGGMAAVLHVRLLSRSVGRFGRSGGSGVGSAFGRIAMVGGIMFLSVRRPDLFAWWATLVGFLSERVSLGIAVGGLIAPILASHPRAEGRAEW